LRVVKTHKGKQVMDDIRDLIGELRDEENQLLQQRLDDSEATAHNMTLIVTMGDLLGVVLVAAAALIINRDLREQRRVETALRESAARFRRLAENATDMIYRYHLAPTPGFDYVSPAATAITGYMPEDYYADPALGINLVHPDDCLLLETFRQSPAPTGAELMVRLIRKDGTVIWADHRVVPIRDVAGGVVAIEGIVRDVTERVESYRTLERRVEERTREIERRRQVAEGLRDIMAILNSDRPLEEILDYIISEACRLLGTDAGGLYHMGGQAGQLEIKVARGLDAHQATLSLQDDWGAIGQAMLTRRPVPVSTTIVTPPDQSDSALEPHRRAHPAGLFDRYGTLLAVPLVVKDDIYGAIALYYPEPREFSKEEIALAVALSDQAALAIENSRLRIRAERAAAAAERNRLARDLHDAVTQTLFSTSLIAEALPQMWERYPDEGRRRLEELRQLTRGALAEMRTMLLELRPAALAEVGLVELLRQLAEAITGRARVPVALSVEGQCCLPPDVQIACYRITQEALNNVVRHANASRATICLECLADRVELCISDNGCGFDPAPVAPDHLGLGIMCERAETVGATMRIDSQPGQGTQVAITWPQAAVLNKGAADGEQLLDARSLLLMGRGVYD
jgi:PAS domain S-box-containing protein